MDVTLAVSRRAGHCWSAGVRCFILIIPLILWLMGPTSLLVTSVVLLLFLVSTDFVRVHNTTHAAGDVEELQARHAARGRVSTFIRCVKALSQSPRACETQSCYMRWCAGTASLQDV